MNKIQIKSSKLFTNSIRQNSSNSLYFGGQIAIAFRCDEAIRSVAKKLRRAALFEHRQIHHLLDVNDMLFRQEDHGANDGELAAAHVAAGMEGVKPAQY